MANSFSSLKGFCSEQLQLRAEVKVDANRGYGALPSAAVTREMSYPATSRQNPQPI